MISNKPLPTNWAEVALHDVVEINPANPAAQLEDEALVSFVPMASVEALTGRVDLSGVRPWQQVKKGYTRFQERDVLVAKITPCMENGKAAIADGLVNGVGAGSTEFHVLRTRGAVEPEMLLHYVVQEEFRKSARANMTGTAGQLRVPSRFLNDQTIPVPPLPEQHRIVAVIDSYFAQLDDAVTSLERVQRNLKRYRASVLKAAVEGRLVPTEAELARAEGRDYEPASVLLERILAERRRRWEEDELTKMKAKGTEPKDDRWRARYEEPATLDSSELSALPSGWNWVRFGSVMSVRGGYAFKSGDYLEGQTGAPLIRQSELKTSNVDITAAKHLPLNFLDEFGDDYGVQDGDILVGLSGSLSSVSVYSHNQPALQNQRTGLLRASPLISKDYILITYLSVIAEIGKAGKGVAVQNVSPKQIESLLIPLPPIREQERIITEVARHLSLIENAERSLNNSARRAERLRQSILKWAFEGRLVDQDPTDEPASKLLERIKSERAAEPARSPTLRPKRATSQRKSR